MHQALTRKLLREFGMLTGMILALLFGILLPWIFGHEYPYWPWIIGGLLALIGLVSPMLLSPVYKIWMKLGHGLGWVNTRIILGVVFYAMFMPFGWVMRLLGKDPMSRTLAPDSSSYRIKSADLQPQNMENPF